MIIAYFEKVQSEKSLYPNDLGDFAKGLFLEELADTKLSEVTSVLYFQKVLSPTIYGKPADNERVDQLVNELIPAQLSLLEKILPATGFLLGNTFSVADIAVGVHLLSLWHAEFNIDPNKFPSIATFYNSFMQRNDVKEQLIAEQQGLKHFASENI